MDSIINIIELNTPDSQSDLVINSTLLETSNEYTIHLKVTDGAIRFKKDITSKSLESLKAPAASNLDYDFKQLIEEVFMNKLPEKFQKSIELIGKQDGKNDSDEALTLQLNLLIGSNIKNELISFDMDPVLDNDEDEEEDGKEDEFDLFAWTRMLKNDRDQYKKQFESLKASETKMHDDLDKALKAQTGLVSEMKAKQDRQFKVFARVLNDFQDYNNKILSGVIVEDEDVFNLDKIKSIIEEVQEAEQAVEPKKRKLTKALKPKKLVKSKSTKKTKDVKHDDTEAQKISEELPPPVKGEVTDSVHFEFNNNEENDKVKQEVKEDTAIPFETKENNDVAFDGVENDNDNEDAQKTEDDAETEVDTDEEATENEETAEDETEAEETEDEELTEEEEQEEQEEEGQ